MKTSHSARRAFNPEADQQSIADSIPHNARPLACFADGCLMPGTIGSGGSTWCCAWHYGVLASDITRVTQALKDWDCVAAEIRTARRVFIGQYATDPKAQSQQFAEAVQRLLPALQAGGWGDQLEPKPGESYGQWALRLSEFLGVQVSARLSTHRERKT